MTRTGARTRWWLVAASALALSGCATSRQFGGDPQLKLIDATALPAPALPVGADGAEVAYTIAPLDQLTIGVFDVEGLEERPVTVDANGNLSFPLAGSIRAAGLTPGQLMEALERRLRAAYLRDPRVSVNVKQQVGRAFTVDGQVNKPGIYPVEGKLSLIRAIAAAGSTSEFAKLEDVIVFRTVGEQRYAALYNLRAIREGRYADPQIYADDVIVVGDSPARRLFKDLLQIVPLITTPIVVALQNS